MQRVPHVISSKIPAHQPLWPDWNATKKDAMLSRLFKASYWVVLQVSWMVRGCCCDSPEGVVELLNLEVNCLTLADFEPRC